MVAYTTAKGLAQVANSSFIGTWDVPTNANWAAVDAATGFLRLVFRAATLVYLPRRWVVHSLLLIRLLLEIP